MSPYRHPATLSHANAMAIRREIQRFESVHPSIYALYELIDTIHSPLLQQQMREHVICIEGQSLWLLDDLQTNLFAVSQSAD